MPKSLLLADDSTTIRTAVGMVFKKEDFALTTVANGTEALQRARDLKPDLILADVDMPGLSGYELCEKIRADAALKQTPVLLLGGGTALDPSRAISVGANGQMAKPFDSQKLIDQVKQILANPKPMAAGAQPAAAVPAARPSAPPPPRPPASPPQQVSRPPPPARPPGQAAGPGAPARPSAPPPAGARPPAPRPATGPPPAGARPPLPGASRPSAPPPPGARPFGAQHPRPSVPPPAAGRPAAPRPAPPAASKPPAPVAARPPPASRPLPPIEAMSTEAEEEILLDDDFGDEAPEVPPLRAVPSSTAKTPLSVVPSAPGRRPAADGGEALLREALSKASREVIERIAWEVVPELAETIIREELDRLMKERGQ